MTGGLWVFVCGPSGAGKDSVIEATRAALAGEPRIVFARRLVTRAAQGDEHQEISRPGFEQLRAQGGLAWHWEAHGQGYGIPAALARDVAGGRIVVVNGSRAHVASLAGRADVRIAEVTAPPARVAERLHRRGREDAQAIAARIARNAALPLLRADLVVDNGGPLEASAARLAEWLLAMAKGLPVPGATATGAASV